MGRIWPALLDLLQYLRSLGVEQAENTPASDIYGERLKPVKPVFALIDQATTSLADIKN